LGVSSSSNIEDHTISTSAHASRKHCSGFWSQRRAWDGCEGLRTPRLRCTTATERRTLVENARVLVTTRRFVLLCCRNGSNVLFWYRPMSRLSLHRKQVLLFPRPGIAYVVPVVWVGVAKFPESMILDCRRRPKCDIICLLRSNAQGESVSAADRHRQTTC
jgi:hypothetical protein